MRNAGYIKSGMLVILGAVILAGSTVCLEKTCAADGAASAQVLQVSPLTVVNSPSSYLNKTVLLKGKFDKFSTLGLDYKSAFKSSEDYISFLIKRDDSNYDIPLSEMKLFLPRKTAEKFIDLKTDDEVEIKGVVFSDALGDTWIDVIQLTVTQKSGDDKS